MAPKTKVPIVDPKKVAAANAAAAAAAAAKKVAPVTKPVIKQVVKPVLAPPKGNPVAVVAKPTPGKAPVVKPLPVQQPPKDAPVAVIKQVITPGAKQPAVVIKPVINAPKPLIPVISPAKNIIPAKIIAVAPQTIAQKTRDYTMRDNFNKNFNTQYLGPSYNTMINKYQPSVIQPIQPIANNLIAHNNGAQYVPTSKPVDTLDQHAENIYHQLVQNQLKLQLSQIYKSQVQKNKQKKRDDQTRNERRATEQTRSRSGSNGRKSGFGGYLSRVFNGFQEKDDEQREKAMPDGTLDTDTEEGISYAAQIFAKFDASHDHKLQKDELYNALKAAGEKPSYGQVSRLIKEFDTDGDGDIDFTEFKEMLKAIQKGTFDDYDSDEEEKWYNETHGQNGPTVKKDYYTPRRPTVQEDVYVPRNPELDDYLGANLDDDTRANAEEFVRAKYDQLIQRNYELEHQNQSLQSSSMNNSGSSYANERNLHEQNRLYESRHAEMSAELNRLRSQQYNLVSAPVHQSRSSYENNLTRTEAKEEARNAIQRRVSESQLRDEYFIQGLENKFNSSFDRLRNFDDRIAQSKMSELTNNMLS